MQRQFTNDMLAESLEGLEQFDAHLLAIEKGADDSETLNSIFRVIHTIKGTSGSLGYNRIEQVAHLGENLLQLVREGKLKPNKERISALLKLSDSLREMLACIQQNSTEGTADYSDLTDALAALASTDSDSEGSGWGVFDGASADAAAVLADPTPAAVYSTPLPAPPVAIAPAPVNVAPAPAGQPTAAARTVADAAIRVNVGQLDRLMNLVGELVLARNQIIQFSSRSAEDELIAASQRLNGITTELQEGVMKTRMQPIGNVWSKFPRVVRDLSEDLGKRVLLMMEGNETELDRTIIEAIKDPLTHIVRNSVDHGIESPDVRERNGKPREGHLLMRAFHEGGQVNIEVRDDGSGIDVERVRAAAVERGLVTADRASRMSDREVQNLIFAPGFSTAEKVTNVSGRGVGMDVVRTNIERIGGSVDVHSEAQRGTTIKIKIPLTLAIIPALICSSGEERFAIPQVSLLELVRLEAELARRSIEMICDAPVYRLRGDLLPLVYLNRELRIPDNRAGDDPVNIVVLQADGRPFGLVVDQINDTEEIVVKPLGKHLKGLSCFSGATIMGDGRVALILDVLGLAQEAEVVSEVHERSMVNQALAASTRSDARQTLLLFTAGEGRNMAIPLSMVARLEEFKSSIIERAGNQQVVQYRGQILTLVRVEDYVAGGLTGRPITETMQVIVYSEGQRSVGLIVDRIQDIVHEAIELKRSSAQPGIVGSTIIQGRVTDVLDVHGLLVLADANFHDQDLEAHSVQEAVA